MHRPLSTGEIYTGATVEEWSERRALQHALTILDGTGQPYVVLANFHLGGRQIDCVIATDNRILVLEVKASRLPVRGSLDGDWQRLEASGQWRTYGNGYRQALAAKNALRDAMQTHKQVGSFYPDAAVVFAAPLPQSSQLTRGDFKVEVLELAALNITGAAGRATPWTIDDWRDFAERLSLTRTTAVELLESAEFGAASSVLRDYRERLAAECNRDGSRWLSESDDQRAELLAALGQSPGLAIVGSSGCGKTLIARWLGSTCASAGECVFFLSAKDFAGSWSKLLRRELALITTTSMTQLLRAVRVTGAPVRIILDGANELEISRSAALVGFRALARRLDARVIITDQSIRDDQVGGLFVIDVAPPTLALKEHIAHSRVEVISSAVRDLLKAVTSGFEASMIAEIGADVRQGASRQLLVDQYVRLRLGDASRSGSVGLRRFAERLVDTMSFSMAETAFDEFLIAAGVTPAAIDPAFSSNLLVRRGGRISFSHEILLNACAAFAFAQHAHVAGAKFAHLLALPSLHTIATDILSVIEDEALVTTILRATRDVTLLTEAAEGLAGQIAAKVASGLLDEVEWAIATELNGLSLSIVSGDPPSVTWLEGARRDWSEEERARLDALSRRIAAGERVERYFEFCAAMDAVLLRERRRLAEPAAAVGINTLKSSAFQLAYLGYGEDTGFGLITRPISSGLYDIDARFRACARRDMMSLTSGQLHFYLERRRLFLDHIADDDLAGDLAELIVQRFILEPYHVKLAILHSATFLRNASPAKLQALIKVIQDIDANRESLFVSTAIVDALKFLGGLEDSAEGARDGIRAQFAEATGTEDDDSIRDLALTLSVAMFDHPYDTIYYEEMEALPEERRRLLLRRAARGLETRKSISLCWILREVASFADPADASIMQEFSRLPDPRNSFPQEEWGAFVVATRFLGRHRLPLLPLAGNTDGEHALIAIRDLVYAAECGDRELSAVTWSFLDTLPLSRVMGCLSEVECALSEVHWSEYDKVPRLSLAIAFADQLCALARRFLESGEEARYYRTACGRDAGAELAFGVIESFGDRGDIALLKRLAQESLHAQRALSALRKIDSSDARYA